MIPQAFTEQEPTNSTLGNLLETCFQYSEDEFIRQLTRHYNYGVIEIKRFENILHEKGYYDYYKKAFGGI